MFCENCGQKLGENSRFCGNCGAVVRSVEASNVTNANVNAPTDNVTAAANTPNNTNVANTANPTNVTNASNPANVANPTNMANPANVTNAANPANAANSVNTANTTNVATTEKESEESFSWTDLFNDIPGRYNRSEYWWRALGYVLVFMIGFSLVADMTDREIERELGTIGYYVVLFILLAVLWGFARCAVKRFHDANYSGYYLGVYYIAVKLITKFFDIDSIDTWVFAYVLIPYFIALILPTHKATNEWGDPR